MATTMEMDPVTSTPGKGELVHAKTILLALSIGTFGNSRQADLSDAVFSKDDPSKEPDKVLLRLTKTLLDSPELAAIQSHDRALSARIRKIAFKSLFKGGVYLLPLGMVTRVEQIIAEASAERAKLIDVAVAKYPERVRETQDRLAVQADSTDYPSVGEFRASFTLSYRYLSFDTPTRLKAISAEVYQQELAKTKAHLDTVAEACEQAMRAGLYQLVDHLAERLTLTNDGKQKRLYESTVGNLNDFLSTFALRNSTDDAELGALVSKAQAIMSGVSKDVLKNDDAVRASVLAEITDLKVALEPLVVEKNRTIRFEDEN